MAQLGLKLNLSGKTIQTTAAYGGSGNRLTCVTDAAGATVSYSYGNSDSVMRSLPTSVTDPNGIVTTSAYDTSGRVTQTGIANTANLLYTYTNGNLSAIQRTNSSGASQTYKAIPHRKKCQIPPSVI